MNISDSVLDEALYISHYGPCFVSDQSLLEDLDFRFGSFRTSFSIVYFFVRNKKLGFGGLLKKASLHHFLIRFGSIVICFGSL